MLSEKTSKNVAKYYINDLILVVYNPTYLVEVEMTPSKMANSDQLVDLPDWVFTSQNAIWLTTERASLMIRAQNGEVIKHELENMLGTKNVIGIGTNRQLLAVHDSLQVQ
jgi:hypothetical protein